MTAVIFKFSLPDGTPVANAPFLVTTRKPSFDETLDNGIQMPGDVSGITDAQGEATLTLMAGFATYYLLMDKPGVDPDTDGCTAGLRYRFMVTESATPIRVEDLIVTTPTWSRPWDETALQIIIDAKVSSQASADAAKLSEIAAGESAALAEGAVAATLVNAEAAAASALAAGQSEIAAHADMLATEGYRNEAVASKDAARVSELAAAASADFAAGAVVDMQAQVDEATLQAGNAGLSATNAAASESAAEADRVQTALDVITTTANKNATAADVVTITGLKGDVVALKDETLGYRDDALEALGSITGVISDGGPIDMSGNVYPAKPTMSTVWQVTVAGTVDTITYNVGDQLFYTKDLDYFYQMDNTSQVRTVAGRMGDVVLAKADVGLDRVDNTNDLEKPLSDAAVTALGLKIDKASIVDDLTSTDATKVLSAKQGKALYDLVQANNATLVVYEFTATLGQTEFTGADDNGLSLVYQVGPGTLVFLNGVQLQKTDDYSATTGTSLTLVNPALQAGDLIQVLAFGAFSVANHYTMAQNDVQLAGKADKADTDTKFADRYTKAQDDALLLTKVDKTAVIDVAHGGTGKTTEFRKGYIDGLFPTWVSATAITFSPGSAYVPGTGAILEAPAAIILTGLVTTANTWYYFYLYNNAGTPAIEMSTVAPDATYFGTARAKTGDTSRRFIFTARTGAANVITQFSWGSDGIYRAAVAAGTAPWRVLADGATVAWTAINCAPALPTVARAIRATVFTSAGAAIYGEFSGFQTWGLGSPAASLNLVISLNTSQQTFYSAVDATTRAYLDITGVVIER